MGRGKNLLYLDVHAAASNPAIVAPALLTHISIVADPPCNMEETTGRHA